jgi:hypothetical protein
MTENIVLPFQKDVLLMTPHEVLDYITYLRRTVAKRDEERTAADPAGLSEDALKTLSEVAKSDHETLATLDELETSIRSQLGA